LRSNFPRGSYLWAVRNAQWRALGIPEEDHDKPKIAIVNSSSGLAACFSHLDAIAAVAEEAIRAAAAVPFEIRATAPSDFVIGAGGRGGYILAARDLVTNDIEVAVEGAQLDGMLCLASCDKTVPGQLMAAARLNIPTIVVACGYQRSDIEDIFVGAMHAQMAAWIGAARARAAGRRWAAVPRAWCSRSTARASPKRSRSSPTATSRAWCARGWWWPKPRPKARCAGRWPSCAMATSSRSTSIRAAAARWP
jgi:dihydroxyacid dehydratase/phosphogluconate dehydratase